jgi:hypothetical protein
MQRWRRKNTGEITESVRPRGETRRTKTRRFIVVSPVPRLKTLSELTIIERDGIVIIQNMPTGIDETTHEYKLTPEISEKWMNGTITDEEKENFIEMYQKIMYIRNSPFFAWITQYVPEKEVVTYFPDLDDYIKSNSTPSSKTPYN